MLRKLRNNENGVVFVTVLMIIIVMMIVAMSIISMNASSAKVTQKEVEAIQAEIFAEGLLAFALDDRFRDTPAAGPIIDTGTENIGPVPFTYTIGYEDCTLTPLTCGPNGTNKITIDINY